MTITRLEMINVSKWRDGLRPGDDVVLALPDRLFAVFDGATDASGAGLGGTSPGRFAATRAAAAMTSLLGEGMGTDPERWLRAMNDAIASGLRAIGAAHVRASSTAAIALVDDASIQLLVVGDSGIRINGNEVLQLPKDVDALFTEVRLAIRRLLVRRGLEGDALEETTRRLVFLGLDGARDVVREVSLLPAEVEAMTAEAVSACGAVLQPDAIATIPEMFRRGIAGGQAPFANRTGHSLGYSSLDGTVTRGPHVCHRVLPRAAVRSLEIYTDGYTSCPAGGITVRDWEENFAADEAADPAKTGRFAGVKGSTATHLSDDRSVVVIEFGPA